MRNLRVNDFVSDHQQYAGRTEKFDDDDGHYIVNTNTPLTDRCEFVPIPA